MKYIFAFMIAVPALVLHVAVLVLIAAAAGVAMVVLGVVAAVDAAWDSIRLALFRRSLRAGLRDFRTSLIKEMDR